MVNYKILQNCESAVFFNLAPDAINESYDYFYMTANAAILVAGDILLLSNIDSHGIYTAMNVAPYQYPNLPMTILVSIGHYYVTVNYKKKRSFCMNLQLHALQWTRLTKSCFLKLPGHLPINCQIHFSEGFTSKSIGTEPSFICVMT